MSRTPWLQRPAGLTVAAAFGMLVVAQFAWTAGYFVRSPSSTVSSSAPFYLFSAAAFGAVALFQLYSIAQRIAKTEAA